eukprot:CAMPEP_0195283388 /NCGR_PEP_ID=MMETSP0707-20130614/1955_1 /TAXON_ID=33640 /ORGANISM="Asterionellopsis glacialis, Strain CCMP134" /LENGTH=373 /DNA_ID=CAMNT_0040342547 /DNA_START=235 /DNA_END=1356 /DNA_ORIENTATION=-
MKFICPLALVAAIATATATAKDSPSFLKNQQPQPQSQRRVADADGYTYSYLDDVSGYSVQFGKCVRAKVPQQYDDDQVEGNTLFYDGKYHAQYGRFASFYLCPPNDNNNKANTCNACDYGTEYVMNLEDFLDSNVAYVQNYCDACVNQCRRRRDRRRLDSDEDGDEDEQQEEEEDEDEAVEIQVNCNTCKDQCSTLINSNAEIDETDYLECDEAYESDNGIQYYSAPQCGPNGELVIGLFYDDECTIKSASEYDLGFEYPTFQTLENMCQDCLSGQCDQLYPETYHCQNGYNLNADVENEDNIKVCKAYKQANKVSTYKKRRKHNFVPLVFLGVLLVGAFLLGSYSYFIRHTRKEPLANLDYAMQNDDLPPVS